MPQSHDPYAVGSDQAVLSPLKRQMSPSVRGISGIVGLLLGWSFLIQALIGATDTPCAMGSQTQFLGLVVLQLILWIWFALRGTQSVAIGLLFVFCAVIQTPASVNFIGHESHLPYTPGWLPLVASQPLIWLVPNALATLTGLVLWPKLRLRHQPAGQSEADHEPA